MPRVPNLFGTPAASILQLVCLSLGATALAAGCLPRGFNTKRDSRANENETGRLTKDALDRDPPGSLTLVPPSDYEADTLRVDASGNPLFPPDANGKPLADASLLMNPVRYFAEVIGPQNRSPALPATLPSKSVLEAFRKVRTLFFKSTPTETTRVPPGVGGFRPTLDDMKAQGLSVISMEADIFPTAPNDPEIRDRCTDFGIPHYSDLMLHYYCQIPSLWRGCHRVLSLAVAKADDADVDAAKKKRVREWVLQTCSTQTDAAFDAKVAEMFLKPVNTMPKVAVFFTQARLSKAYFQAFHETQWTTNEKEERVNMFDFIMSAQPYAFAPDAEAAVINAYYGEMKPAVQGAFNPADTADCHNWRLPRKEEDPKGNYCDWRTPKIAPVHSIGR